MKVTLRLRLPCRYLIKLLRYHLHHKPLFALVLLSASSSSADFIVYSLLPVASAEYGLSSPAHVTIIRISHFPNPLMPLPFITPEEVALTISIRPLLLVSSPLQAACLLCSTDPAVMLSLTIALYVNEFDLECVFVGLPPCVCVYVLPSAAGNLITALMHQRERKRGQQWGREMQRCSSCFPLWWGEDWLGVSNVWCD